MFQRISQRAKEGLLPSLAKQEMVKTAVEMIDGAEKYMVYRRADLDILI
ncbi:MAG: hypothetical protein ACJ70M_00650 [Nitrososphaera sp.]